MICYESYILLTNINKSSCIVVIIVNISEIPTTALTTVKAEAISKLFDHVINI